MTSVRGRGRPAQRGQASEALTSLFSSNKSDDGDHKDSLGPIKPGPFEVLAEAPAGLPQAPPFPVSQDPGTNRYSHKDLDRIIQTFLYALKGGSGDNLKAKTPDVYCGRSYMECYNFCQKCENHFATCKAIGPNRIPFAASFLRDRINFRWQ